MLNIKKVKIPSALVAFRKTDSSADSGKLARYEELDQVTRQELVSHLLEDQGHLCCYCMGRIGAEGRSRLRVEHWHCQSRYPREQLDYRNMLAACGGNEGKGQPHCDVAKQDQDFAMNPADPGVDIEARIRYLPNGAIVSDDMRLNSDLVHVLNLNFERLKRNRAGVIRAVNRQLDNRRGTRSRRQIEKLLSGWMSADSEGRLRPYAGAARYWLGKRLRRAR